MADEFSSETDSREPYCRRHGLLSATFTYKTPRCPPMVRCSDCRNNKSFLKNGTVTFSYFSPLATSILQKFLGEPVLEKWHMRLVIHWRSTFTRGLGGIGTRRCDILWRSMELGMLQKFTLSRSLKQPSFLERHLDTSFCDKVNCLDPTYPEPINWSSYRLSMNKTNGEKPYKIPLSQMTSFFGF